jgi:phage major head subunit gpT-like protein
MLVRPSNWNVFQSIVQTSFWMAYADAPAAFPVIAKTVPCGSRFYVEGWQGRFPKPRRWVGSRVVHTPAPQTYQVEIFPKEDTVGLDLYELRDDVYGVFNSTIPNLAINAKQDFDWELRDLVEDEGSQTGAAQLGTDQLTHWNGAHPVDFYDASAGTYPNDYGASGTSVNGITVGGALGPNAFATVRQDMMNRKSETGEPMGIQADLLMVATQNEYVGDTILQAQFLGVASIGGGGAGGIGTGNAPTPGQATPANSTLVGTTNNILKGKVDQLTWAALFALPAAWYMLKTRGPIKPFQIAQNEAYQLTTRSSPTDPVVWDTHQVQYGITARFSPTWAPPFLSSRSGV